LIRVAFGLSCSKILSIVKVIPHRPDPVVSTQPRSFGQARAARYQQRLETLLKQNQALIGAKNVSTDRMQANLASKQELVLAEINQLQNKQKDEVSP